MRESAETSWNTPAFINHINAADNSQRLHSDSASCKSLWKDPSRISLGQTCNWVLHFRYECFEHWANTAPWNPLKLRCNSDVTQGSKPSFSFFRSLRTHFVCVCVCVYEWLHTTHQRCEHDWICNYYKCRAQIVNIFLGGMIKKKKTCREEKPNLCRPPASLVLMRFLQTGFLQNKVAGTEH